MTWTSANWSFNFCIVLLCFIAGSATQHVDEARLIALLKSKAAALARPSNSSYDPVRVEFDLKLLKIKKLSITDEVLVTHTSIVMRWTDHRLKWNPKNFNGVDLVNLANGDVWTPDVLLYNTADDSSKSPSDIYRTPVHVHSNGTLVWFSTVVWKSSCSINVVWFPIDEQHCRLIFASKSYTKRRLQLALQHPSILEGKEITHGEWSIEKMSAKTSEHKRDCCDYSFSQVVYKIELKRKPLYFLLYLILPMMAVVFLSILIFQIPAETGERVGFAVTILLTMGVYLMVISQDLPRKGDSAPLVGVLYVILFYVVTFGCVTGIMTTSIAYKFTRPPRWLRILVLKITRNKSSKLGVFDTDSSIKSSKEIMKIELEDIKEGDEENGKSINDSFDHIVHRREAKQPVKEAPSNEHTQEECDHKKQWEVIGFYIDRIFFWFYIFLVFGTSVAVFSYFRN